jgi:hypothetical protein
MTEAILLSGKRGEGKSISAARMMASYIRRGCTVATNMDIRMEHMARPWSKLICYRLPDHPDVSAFESLPLGNENPVDESKNGLLVLDEVATFLNSRDWQARDRAAVIRWLLHSRKYGWDLLLIAQHPRLVDAQIRDSLCEVSATARRADKLPVPILGSVFKMIFGKTLKLPRAHVVTFRYGFVPGAPKLDIWWFSGREYQDCYDSLQKISFDGQAGLSCYLPAWHLKGRNMSRVEMYRGVGVAGVFLGLLLGVGLGFYLSYTINNQSQPVLVDNSISTIVDDSVFVQGVIRDGVRESAILSDGRTVLIDGSQFDKSGVIYRIGSNWYRGK